MRRLFDLPYLLLTLTPLFWAGNAVLGRAVHEVVPPVGMAFWRWVGAFLIVLPFAWRPLRRDWPLVCHHWKLLLVFAFLGVTVFNSLLFWALNHTTAINATLTQSSTPMAIIAFSFLLFRERITGAQGLGIVVSLSGVMAIITRGDPDILASLTLNPGDLIMLGAVACYALYSALLKKRPPLHHLSFLAVTFGAGMIMLLPLYLWETLNVRPVVPDPATLATIAYMMIFPSILSYLFFNRGVELAGPNRAGLFFHLIPLFASLMAVAFLGETFRWFHGAGMGLILVGIWLANKGRPERPRRDRT